MNEKAGQFRSAAFGGFHRQDVLDYLESRTKENREQLESLQKELGEEKAARQAAESRVSQLEAQVIQGEADRAELERIREEMEKKTAALTESEARVTALRLKVSALEPEAASWNRIKSTAGDIEVGAHERAQIILQDAKARQAEIQADGVRYILDIQARCDKLQQDLHLSILNAETELDVIRRAFTETEADVEGYQKALSELIAAMEQTQ